MIFRDSFFTTLEPYFTRKLLKSTIVSGTSDYMTLNEHLKNETPDLIIEEWVERNFPFTQKQDQQYEKSIIENKFINSQKVVFTSKDQKVKFNKWLTPKKPVDKNLKLTAIGKDPIIFLPSFPIEVSTAYVINIKMWSSVDSTSQVFYSQTEKTGNRFSQKRSISLKVSKGENDLYFILDQLDHGARLRFDPISKPGELNIKLVEVRQVEAQP